MYYEALFQRLNQRRVKYVVCGGVAAIMYGVPRYTKDTDLLCDLSGANRARLWDAMMSLGYKPVRPVTRKQFVARNAVAWLKNEKNAVVFSFVIPDYSFLMVDVLLESPVDFREARRRATRHRLRSVVIPTVSIQDLFRMKKKANRQQDLSDIRTIKKVMKDAKTGAQKIKRA